MYGETELNRSGADIRFAQRNTIQVTAVVLLGGGHVLTGGDDGDVKLWAPASAGGGLRRTFRPPSPSRLVAPAGAVIEAIVYVNDRRRSRHTVGL